MTPSPVLEPQDEDIHLMDPPFTQGSPNHPLWPAVCKALRGIYDPEIPVNIYELGLIYTVTITNRADGRADIADIGVAMTLTSPACPVAQEMPEWIQSALLAVAGVGDVEVLLVWDPPWGAEMMAPTAKMELNLFGEEAF